MKTNKILSFAILALTMSSTFISCDKENKKKETPSVTIVGNVDHAKELVGDYNATIEVNAHNTTLSSKGIVKLKSNKMNQLSIDIPSFKGRPGKTPMIVDPFTIPNVGISIKEGVYTLNAPEQTISVTMGKAYPESKVTTTGTVKAGTLALDLTWEPAEGYIIKVNIKDAKKANK